MRRSFDLLVLALAGLSLALALRIDPAVAAASSGAESGSTACPATSDDHKLAVARAWHEEAINRRNPPALRDILAPEVVHHAAGGYPAALLSRALDGPGLQMTWRTR